MGAKGGQSPFRSGTVPLSVLDVASPLNATTSIRLSQPGNYCLTGPVSPMYLTYRLINRMVQYQ
jgi:hypothetical protein